MLNLVDQNGSIRIIKLKAQLMTIAETALRRDFETLRQRQGIGSIDYG